MWLRSVALASRRRFFRRTNGASHTRASGAERGRVDATLASALGDPSAWLLLSFRLSHPSKVRRGIFFSSFPCAEFLPRWSFILILQFVIRFLIPLLGIFFIDLRFVCIWVISWEI